MNITTADVTYYVSTAGNDGNDGLTPATALLTIQAAINKIPRVISHHIVVNVGPGNFAGFVVTGRTVDVANGSFIIRGSDFVTYTPPHGNSSGTGTNGNEWELIDATQSWGVNELCGKLVYVNGDYLYIRSNTATALYTVGVSSSTMMGKAYVLKDHSTIINSTSHPMASIFVDANLGTIILEKLKVASTSGVHNIYISQTNATIRYIWANMPTASPAGSAITVLATGLPTLLENIYTCDSFIGIRIFASSSAVLLNTMARTNTYAGVYVDSSSAVFLDHAYGDDSFRGIVMLNNLASTITGSKVRGNSLYGIEVLSVLEATIYGNECESNLYGMGLNTPRNDPRVPRIKLHGSLGALVENIVLKNNTQDGLIIGSGSVIGLGGITGTGNGGHGMYVRFGAHVIFTTTTVTGSGGDIKLGTTTYSYASDFATDGDYKVDASEDSFIKRIDTLAF